MWTQYSIINEMVDRYNCLNSDQLRTGIHDASPVML